MPFDEAESPCTRRQNSSRTPECATRPGRGSRAGSPDVFQERHASREREPRGLTGCLPGAPRVPGEGATRAYRVPPGCATRPGKGSHAGSPGAPRVHRVTWQECGGVARGTFERVSPGISKRATRSSTEKAETASREGAV